MAGARVIQTPRWNRVRPFRPIFLRISIFRQTPDMPDANHPDLTALLARVGRMEEKLGRTRDKLAPAKA